MKTENVFKYLKKAGEKLNKTGYVLHEQMGNKICIRLKIDDKWVPNGVLKDISELGLVIEIEHENREADYYLFDWSDIDYIFWSSLKQ